MENVILLWGGTRSSGPILPISPPYGCGYKNNLDFSLPHNEQCWQKNVPTRLQNGILSVLGSASAKKEENNMSCLFISQIMKE